MNRPHRPRLTTAFLGLLAVVPACARRARAVADRGPVLLRADSLPRFPLMLRSAGLDGHVELALTIEARGHVEPGGLRVIACREWPGVAGLSGWHAPAPVRARAS